ncbi:MAG: hypothetical protein EOQ62_03920 [Mesorhizobium sp.]|uniref:hypothetical protein n=1 Tax=Mesorhizobium sp. TaxID=1871066 RepID=UPI000FEA817B|nr:hypothetical protein [Mesorhizobium sp.]RWG50443.1 MAG: hypothetical protein EOQ62_03920 [Mesorhizobium sp.]RWL05200.1 MAG: hypothetical protein EOR55_13090 [Mesorhizobium sp.]TIN10223.1 MAG: hypothetical protein E5Y14_11840 [Mesorhizobium sp.]TIQ62179.1 MAG: hypothetical protein E5X41_29615 [Mesorhizobium sp.]
MKIFWSWQSDTPQASGRHFVRSVLTDLAKELNGVEGAEDAERPESGDGEREALSADEDRVEIDHDTLNVGGSPVIAETILRKIREAAVFVADVTPVCTILGSGKRVPNPNVMIELGYALEVVGHQRIVLVMNGAEGASVSHLPFDLRHWRFPAVYKLSKGATEEHRQKVAAELKESLRERIEPGLSLAKVVQAEKNRQTNRAPKLSVAVGDGPDNPRTVAQVVPSLDIETLEEIRAATPLLPLPALPHPRWGSLTVASSRASSAQSLFGSRRPPNEWSREETEGYNQWVERYYSDYRVFLQKMTEYQRLMQRSLELVLKLENKGTLAATAIDVDVIFPGEITLIENAKTFAALKPVAPEPPELRPMGPGAAIVKPVPFSPGVDDLISRFPRSTHVYPSERRVHFTLDELKHNHKSPFNAFIICLVKKDDIASFEATYTITANEPVDPIYGSVRFEVALESD